MFFGCYAGKMVSFVFELIPRLVWWVPLVGVGHQIDCKTGVDEIDCADETIYSNFVDTLHWLENTDVLEMIVDKFSSSVSTLDHSVT